MSVRREVAVVAAGPRTGRRSSRVDEALRDGQLARGALVTAADAESGLTQALKRNGLAPTGVCLPRNFDPDYCAYDRYYTVGVAIVSAVTGVLVETRAASLLPRAALLSVEKVLGTLCYTVPEKEPDGWFFSSPEPQQYYDGSNRARKDFNTLCKALMNGLDIGIEVQAFPFFFDEPGGRTTSSWAPI